MNLYIRHPLVIALLSVPVLALLVTGTWFGVESALCENKLVREERSPNGKNRAVLFSRKCGSSPTAFHLSIFDNLWPILDTETGNTVIKDQEFTFHWKSDREFMVEGFPLPWTVQEAFYGIHVAYSGDQPLTNDPKSP